MTTRYLLALALVAGLVLPASAQDPPAFTLVPTTLTLAPGQTGTRFTVVVLAKGLTPDKTGALMPTLTDQPATAFPGAIVTPKFESTTDATVADRRWTFTVTVSKFPAADTQSRVFLLSYGNVHTSLAYTLTNQAGKTFTWSVKTATEWNAATMKSLGLAIKIGDLPATGVKLGAINLISEDKRKVTLGTSHLELCANETGAACTAVPGLEARAPVTLHLRAKDLPVGVFKGTIAIAAADKTDPEVLQLTIYSPRTNWEWWGFGALAAGTIGSLILHVFMRPFFQRLRERQSLLVLRKSVEGMKTGLAAFHADIVAASQPWSTDADKLLEDIRDIPVRSPIPLPFDEEVAGLASFKTLVEACTARLLHLRLRFRDGLVEVQKLFAAHATHPNAVDAVKIAAREISLVLAGNDAAKEIAGHLNELRRKLNEAPKGVLAGASRSTQDELATIAFQLSAASLVIWVFWGLISVATGMLLLVYSNPAFGTSVDLWTCVLWALGVSVVGQQASQVTPGGIATNIGVNLPGKK